VTPRATVAARVAADRKSEKPPALLVRRRSRKSSARRRLRSPNRASRSLASRTTDHARATARTARESTRRALRGTCA
jgi:hypothetical protein